MRPVTLLSICCAALCVALAIPPAATRAEPPPDVSYQGQLLDSDRKPLAGPVNMQLRLYANPDPTPGESAFYVEDHGPVTLQDGVFDLLLGQGTPVTGVFDADLFQQMDRWLEVWVNGERLAPRQPISSVPYAFQTANASRLAGKGLPEIQPPNVFDAAGRELGSLVAIQTGFAGTSCMSADPMNPAGREISFFHRPTNLLFSACLLSGQRISPAASLAMGLFFTGAGCTGNVYGMGDVAGFAEVFRGRVYGGTGPAVSGVHVLSQGYPSSGPAFPESCTDGETFYDGLIPLADVTEQVELTFPFPAPLTIGAPAP